MICAHCSTPVADEARFCHSCGSLVSDAEGQAAATASMDQSSFQNMERLLREDTQGEYTISHLLGRGGMAVVYLATETALSRKVAIKVLPPELTFGHGVERFKREAKTAAALDHPNIIPIYRIASSGKLFWYAMKFLEGKSLDDLLKERGSFPLDEAIDVLEQVADALDYAHEHQVIHRDIKPANVMLDNRNRVIVTDFGIAKALTEGKLTATDSVIGTPYFMSPEQGMGKPVSGAADQYSVAVMAYRMLAGHVPFDGDSAIDILHKHCMFEAPSLHDDVPDIPPHVSDAIARALSKKAEERFASVHDFVQAMKDPDFVPKETATPSVATVIMDPSDAKKLRSVASSPAGSATGKGRTVVQPPPTQRANPRAATRPRPAPAPTPKSKAGLYISLLVVVLAGGGVGYWQMTKPRPGPNPLPATNTTTPTSSAGPATSSPDAAGDPAMQAAYQAPPPPSGGTTATGPAPSGSKPPASKPSPAPKRDQVRPPTPTPVATAPKPTPQAPTPAPTAEPDVGANTMLATMQVRLTPPARVTLDGRPLGEKSGISEQLVAGTHRLRIEKDGFITRDTTVTLSAGETTRFSIRLEPRP